MHQIIEKIASDSGLSCQPAHCAYTAIISQLLNNVPELESFIDRAFASPEPESLRKEINKLANLLQYRGMEHFKNFSMPENTYRFRLHNELL